MDAQTALGAEDYQMLAGMLMSPDASVRAQGQGLAKKLTPPEQQEFFDFQKQANAGKDATSQRADSNMVSVGGVGIAPEDALAGGQIVRGVAGAVGSGGAAAGAKAALGHAAGYAKFEVVKHGLVALGVPHGVADAAALFIACRGGAATEAEAANPDLARIVKKVDRPNGAISPTPLRERFPNGLPRAEPPTVSAPPTAAPAAPVASAPVAPAPVVAAPAPVAPPAPPVAPPSPQLVSGAPSPSAPSPAAAALPDQRALNEAALAVRRQAYQQRLAAQASAQVAETTPPVAAPAAAGNVKLSAAETKAFLDLMKRGMSGPEAMKNVLLQRSLVDTLGTPTPTAAQTRFPKGQRGKVSQP